MEPTVTEDKACRHRHQKTEWARRDRARKKKAIREKQSWNLELKKDKKNLLRDIQRLSAFQDVLKKCLHDHPCRLKVLPPTHPAGGITPYNQRRAHDFTTMTGKTAVGNWSRVRARPSDSTRIFGSPVVCMQSPVADTSVVSVASGEEIPHALTSDNEIPQMVTSCNKVPDTVSSDNGIHHTETIGRKISHSEVTCDEIPQAKGDELTQTACPEPTGDNHKMFQGSADQDIQTALQTTAPSIICYFQSSLLPTTTQPTSWDLQVTSPATSVPTEGLICQVAAINANAPAEACGLNTAGCCLRGAVSLSHLQRADAQQPERHDTLGRCMADISTDAHGCTSFTSRCSSPANAPANPIGFASLPPDLCDLLVIYDVRWEDFSWKA